MRKVAVIIFCLYVLFISDLRSEYEPVTRQLLILHSYSPSMEWVNEMNSGISEIISKEHSIKIQITYEFLEAKRFHSPEYFMHTAQAFKFKYSITSFDAIISCDDHAFDFIRNYRDICFPGVPVFFCGVNDIYQELNYEDIRGIFEANPLQANISLMRKLMLNLKNILIVIDPNTRTNNVHRERIIKEIIPDNTDIGIEMTGNMTFKELEEKLTGLPEDTCVLYFSYLIDSTGEYLSHIPIAERLLKRCNCPVFILNKIYLDLGVIGGYVTNPRAHGAAAALMATDFLRGVPLNNLDARDYMNSDLYQPVFNLRKLKQYKLNLNDLPQNYQLYKSKSEFEAKTSAILPYSIWAIILLTVLLIYLLYIYMVNRRNQLKLLNRDMEWQSLTENLPAVVFRIDQQGRYNYINSSISRYFGINKEALLNRTVKEVGLSEVISKIDEDIVLPIFEHKKTLKYEYNYVNPLTNEEFYFETRYVPEFVNGKVKYILGIVLDITQRHQYQLELISRERQYLDLFNSLLTGFAIQEIIFDDNGKPVNYRFLSVNPAFEKILNLKKKNVIGKLVLEVIPDLEPYWIERYGKVALSGESVQFSERSAFFNKWFQVSAYRVGEKKVATVFMDITDNILMSEELQQRNLELKGINKELQDKIDKAVWQMRDNDHLLVEQSRLAALGEMLSIIGHEWRQPLNSLGLIIQDIKDSREFGELTEEFFSQKVNNVISILQTISGTIEEFRFFFCQKQVEDIIDIGTVIRKTVNFIRDRSSSEGIEIITELEENCLVEGETSEFAQIILNILANSFEAFQEQSIPEKKIWITLQRRENHNLLKIADNAGGIAEEFLDKVFLPYFSIKTKAKGTGIGLFMARKLVETKFKGSITLRNKKNGVEINIET
ncbi:MAG: PAS domain S-box protein [Candidatus Cloacimonetes bacterium]|nr:PAS domain S-box protein [Candidatus Cloacimonadota bacterium]